MLCGCSDSGNSKSFAPDSIRAKITAAAPAGWDAIDMTDGQRAFEDCFKDSRIRTLVLLGPVRNYVGWDDAYGEPHQEYIARECLCFWIVPNDFRPAIPWFDPCGPEYPAKVWSSRTGVVYARVSHHITDKKRLREILDMKTHFWTGDVHISWKDWQRSLKATLDNVIRFV